MRTIHHALSCALFLSVWVTAAAGAEMVDNPVYQSWAKHQPGTSVTQKVDMNMTSMTMSQDATQKLISVTPEKVVVETSISMDVGGQKKETSAKQDIPAKVEKGREYLPPNVKGTYKELGNDKIEVGGKSYDCVAAEFTGETPQGKVQGKTWRTPEIPGMMAKLEMTIEGPSKVTVAMRVNGFEIK